jgi:hypothetical protein
MGTVEQEGSAATSGESTPPLMNQAENSFRELVAFYEIIADLSGQPQKNVASEWIGNYKQFLDDTDLDNFDKTMGNLIEAMQETKSRMERSKEPFSVNVEVVGKGTEEIIANFMVEVVHRLGNRAVIISRAFLIAAESSFEVLFGQLARAIYTKNPGALPKSDYSFTLEELSKYSSMSEAREFLVGHRIEALLRESLDEWGKWLKRTINIELDQVMPDWPATREIFIRRNMLVHTDGKITERYLNELRRVGNDTSGLEVGQSLVPSVGYLQDSLQRLIALEVLLVFRVRSRLEKSDTNVTASWLATKLDFLVQHSMWDSVSLISESFEGSRCRRSIQLSIMINGWLARKNRDGLDSIRQEVSVWDVSGLNKRFVVLKKALLDQLSSDELTGATEDGVLSRFEAATHPLFANINPAGSSTSALAADPDAESETDTDADNSPSG